MRGWVLRVLVTVGLLTTVSGSLSVTSAPGAYFFTLGFRALHDQIPGIVGDCRGNEHFEVSTGNSLQATTSGLMVWRSGWANLTESRTCFTQEERLLAGYSLRPRAPGGSIFVGEMERGGSGWSRTWSAS